MAEQPSLASSRVAGVVIVGGIGALLAAALLTYFAYAATVEDVPDYGGTYIEGTLGPPPTLVPMLAKNDSARTISSLIFNGLTRYAEDGTIAPDLATRWEIDTQSRSYTFFLRDGVTWHDGTPFTVDDVLFTYGLLTSPVRNDPVWKNVRAEREGDRGVRIYLLNNVYLPLLEYATMGILPKHRLDGVSADQIYLTPFNLQPVGTGPYRIVEFTEEFALLRANDQYFGGRPRIRFLKFKFYPNAKATITALERGEVEGVSYLPTSEIARVGELADVQEYSAPLQVTPCFTSTCAANRSSIGRYGRQLPMPLIAVSLPAMCREERQIRLKGRFCRSPGRIRRTCSGILMTLVPAGCSWSRRVGRGARTEYA